MQFGRVTDLPPVRAQVGEARAPPGALAAGCQAVRCPGRARADRGGRLPGGLRIVAPQLHEGQAVPPLTRMFCAVAQPAASLAKNATTAAISAGWPSRANALIASRLAKNCSLLPVR